MQIDGTLSKDLWFKLTTGKSPTEIDMSKITVDKFGNI